MVKVDGGEGGESSLSGQIAPAKGVRKEALDAPDQERGPRREPNH
jgi:hypothetical protein